MVEPFTPITREEAAKRLSVSLGTIDNMIEHGEMPKPKAIGRARRLYWHPEIFFAWLDKMLREEAAPSPDTNAGDATSQASAPLPNALLKRRDPTNANERNWRPVEDHAARIRALNEDMPQTEPPRAPS
jgi:excisionase family DNA binding protein